MMARDALNTEIIRIGLIAEKHGDSNYGFCRLFLCF